MLVLTRKTDETIMIGDQIVIKVLGISDGQVKIGVEAPRSVKIFRAEVYEAIQRQNVAATRVSKQSVQNVAGLLAKQSKRKE
ncbi:MAG: carbon storage regulator CsrA [Ignavibacteriales bacterium]|nr:carbon storage regulator CsrA [Ignavibacteriales bacterium]